MPTSHRPNPAERWLSSANAWVSARCEAALPIPLDAMGRKASRKETRQETASCEAAECFSKETTMMEMMMRMSMSMLMTILIIMKMMMVVLRMTTTIMTVIAVIMII